MVFLLKLILPHVENIVYYRGAARYLAKFMGESSFNDTCKYLFVLSKDNYNCHKLLHSLINFAGCLAAPMIFKGALTFFKILGF